MIARLCLLLLGLALVGCAAPPATPTPTASATVTPLPRPPTFPPSATVTPPPLATPTLAATPTPPPPTMQSYLDPSGTVRLRLPTTWQVASDTEGPGLLVRASAPDGASIAIAEVAMPLDPEAFMSAYVGDATTLQRTVLEDGTVRYGGLDPQRGPIDYRFRQVGPLVLAALLAEPLDTPASIAEAFWAGLRFFPSRAAARFTPPPALPTPSAADLVVTTGGTLTPAEGTLELLGELFNGSGSDVEGVRVTVELLSADGRAVATASGPIEHDLLLAGARSPFRVTFSPAPPVGSWVGARATAQGSPAAFVLDRAALWLHATAPSGQPTAEGSGYLVTSVVQNEGSAPASFVRLVATLYDETDRVIGVGSAYADSVPLEAGSSRSVTITLPELAAPASAVARIAVGVEGKR